MSAHRLPATCRCLWCPRTFDTAAEVISHMTLSHPARLVGAWKRDAAAQLERYHDEPLEVGQEDMAVESMPNTPRRVGRMLAERLSGVSDKAFLIELDSLMDHMRDSMLATGNTPSVVLLICREMRHAARDERASQMVRLA